MSRRNKISKSSFNLLHSDRTTKTIQFQTSNYTQDYSMGNIGCTHASRLGSNRGEVYIRAKGAHRAGAYPGFCSMKRLGVFLLPLDGILFHHRVTPSIKFAGTHLHTWVERGTVRVKCLAQEHNTMSPA